MHRKLSALAILVAVLAPTAALACPLEDQPVFPNDALDIKKADVDLKKLQRLGIEKLEKPDIINKPDVPRSRRWYRNQARRK